MVPFIEFVNNKQLAFLKTFISQQLLFLFSKNLDTMANVTDCGYSKTNFCLRIAALAIPKKTI